MEYHIRRWGNPDLFVVISESEYLALVSARQSLTALLGAEEKFDVLLENYIRAYVL